MTIRKYELRDKSKQEIALPVGATILAAQERRGGICLWALVDEHVREFAGRYIEIFLTGEDMPQDMGVSREYIGTVHLPEQDMSVHVFDRL